jgi:hypothetical protein
MARPKGKYETKPKYVYMYKDKDGTPYYIGQGSTGRALAWQKKPMTWEHIPPYNSNTLHFVDVDLTVEEADELETFLIEELGRVDMGTGPLLNRTNGGKGRSGYIADQKCSKSHSEGAKKMWERRKNAN